ncbi:MAG TPA: spore coat U domain-containing protein [Gemmatimonadaceae bacterium]|jgi:spore coat protein U-like protein
MVRHRAGLQVARSFALALAVGLIGAPAPIDAQLAESGMSMAATVSRSCQIDGGSLAFGNYDPVAGNAVAPLDAETIIVLTCTKGTPAVLALNAGGHAQGTLRFMANGTNLLNYDLYQDSGRNQHWGDAPGDTLTVGPSTGDPRSIYVYGRVPANQDVQVGSFNDSVVATVLF